MSGVRILAVLGCGVAFYASAAAIAPEDSAAPGPSNGQYQGIIDRNVFALKPPTPPPKPEENHPPPPNIKLTGITTILGKKLVLLKVSVPATKGAKAEDEAFTLAVGERQGEVQVLDVDEINGIVKVDDYGTITNLNWDNNGIKVATPAPAPPPPAPGAPPPAAPGAFNPAMPVQRPGRTVPTNPNRQIRTQGSAANGASGYNPAAYGAASATPAYGNTALNGLGQPASPINGAKTWPPEENDPDHQALMDAAYQMKYQQQIQAGTMPDVPGPSLLNQQQPQQPQQPNRNQRAY